MVKKFINLVLLAVFVCGISLIPFNELSAKAESPKVANLTQEEIANKFLEIDSKYEVGEELSNEDAKFIKKYAKVAEQESVVKRKDQNGDLISTLGTGTNFAGRGSNPSGSIAASTIGTYTLNIGWINQSYSISMTTAMTKGSASSIKNSYTHTAYGAIGAGGVGKVYSNTDSSSCSNQSCYSYFSDSYSAIVAYYTTVVKSVVTYSGGSFTISVSGL